MQPTITRNEWLSEFERVMRQPRKGDPGWTARELSDLLGVGSHRVNTMLREAFRQGRLKCGRKPDMTTDGRRVLVPCYQLVPEKKAAKKR